MAIKNQYEMVAAVDETLVVLFIDDKSKKASKNILNRFWHNGLNAKRCSFCCYSCAVGCFFKLDFVDCNFVVFQLIHIRYDFASLYIH